MLITFYRLGTVLSASHKLFQSSVEIKNHLFNHHNIHVEVEIHLFNHRITHMS